MSASEYTLTPVRRVVTGHTNAGKSTMLTDTQIASYSPPNIPTRFSDVFWTDAVPCDNSAPAEFPKGVDVIRPTGSIIRVVDLPPGAATVSSCAHVRFWTHGLIRMDSQCTGR